MAKPPERAQLDEQPADSPHHDVLVFPPDKGWSPWWFWRFPVVKRAFDPKTGDYTDAPELWNFEDSGQRKVALIAKPHLRHNSQQPRGPAFSTLPVKPEPGPTSITTCYLINAENLNYINPWTVDEWNDVDRDEVQQACEHCLDETSIEAVIAGPQGTALHLKIAQPAELPVGDVLPIKVGNKQVGELVRLDLRYEMEIWNQLRNGCVAGRATLRQQDHRVVPLVNLTALTPHGANHGVDHGADQ